MVGVGRSSGTGLLLRLVALIALALSAAATGTCDTPGVCRAFHLLLPLVVQNLGLFALWRIDVPLRRYVFMHCP